MSSSPQLFSPEPVRPTSIMLSPQRGRTSGLQCASPPPRTPCKKVAEGSPPSTPRCFWFHGSASDGMSSCEVPMLLPAWLPAFGQERALSKPHAQSVASTMTPGSMTPGLVTPSLDDYDFAQSLPQTPELARTSASPDPQSLACDCQLKSPRGQEKNDAQVRKVFVGGVPKSIDQHQLRVFFNTFGKVQKAWLQYVRHGQPQTVKEHRGFGFVVFCERSALDNLLGADFSRFVKLENGPRVEVKRAVNNSDMELPEYPTAATRAKRARDPARRNGVTCCEPRGMRARDNEACEMRAAHARAESEGTIRGTSETLEECERGSACVSLPYVPPMPIDGSCCKVRWCGNAFGDSSCGNTCAIPPNVHRMPIQPLPFAIQCTPAYSSKTVPPVESHPLDILLKEFVGTKPRNSAELAVVLTQAMPERYED